MARLRFSAETRRTCSTCRWLAVVSLLSLAVAAYNGAYLYVKIKVIRTSTCNPVITKPDAIASRSATSVHNATTAAINESSNTTSWRSSSTVSFECIKTLKELTYAGKLFSATREKDVLPVCQKSINETKHNAVRHSDTVIPNIAHFLWFYDETPLRFDQFISILSALTVLKADKIMIHTDNEPIGKYWEILKERIDVLQVVPLELPNLCAEGRFQVYHRTDLARLQILLKYGGIYLDTDVIVVKSMEPLRHYDFVMGREQPLHPEFMNNGVMMASRTSIFLEVFYRGYQLYYGKCWSCDSIKFPNALAIHFPELIHVEERGLHQMDSFLTFRGHFDWRKDYYTVHTYFRQYLTRSKNKKEAMSRINLSPEIFREGMKHLNCSFGEIARYVYYRTIPQTMERL